MFLVFVAPTDDGGFAVPQQPKLRVAVGRAVTRFRGHHVPNQRHPSPELGLGLGLGLGVRVKVRVRFRVRVRV